MTITNYNFTELELQIIENIKNVDCPTYFFASDIVSGNTEKNKQLRGALSSLVKKGVLDINNEDGGLISVYARDLFEDGFFN